MRAIKEAARSANQSKPPTHFLDTTGLAFASWDLLPWSIPQCLLQRMFLESPSLWQSPTAWLSMMPQHFKGNKRHPKLTQKGTAASRWRVRHQYFLPRRQVLHLHSGKQQAFSGHTAAYQSTAHRAATGTCKCHFLAASWLAWATSLDSALLFCSATLVNGHTPREWSYFQPLHIPARPISNCKERIRQS